MPKEVIQPEGLPTPASYSPVVVARGTIAFFAGQTPLDEQGAVVGKGDIAAQTEQVYQNIGKCLTAVGATFDDLVRTQTFVTDPRYLPIVSEIRRKYLKAPYPAGAVVVVAALASPDYLVEVEAAAVIP